MQVESIVLWTESFIRKKHFSLTDNQCNDGPPNQSELQKQKQTAAQADTVADFDQDMSQECK
jgi:hypothetical protein